MRRLVAFVIVLTAAKAHAECPNVEAIELANRADAVIAINPDDAIDKLKRATFLDPSNARIFYKLARAYLKKENWAEVAKAASHAAKLAPGFANYHWLHGYALANLEAWPQAKEALTASLAVDPGYADAHFDLASTLEHLHDEAGALDHYTRAIRAAPSKVEYYGPLADLYRRLGYLDQAAAVAREGLTWNPSPRAHFTLATLAGLVAETRKAMPEALARYREAQAACGACNERGEAIAFLNLGMALATAKPPQKAEAESNLVTFEKIVCKGALAMRYADECTETQQMLLQLRKP